MKNLVILISGRGSNMEALVRACRAEQWPARVAAVIASSPDAPGLVFAKEHGIATAVVNARDYPERALFDQRLAEVVDSFSPALVLLAGFMRVLGETFVQRYTGRLLNVHPSLLPSFTGLHTHQRALDAGVKVHGATVHFVTPVLDHGPIMVQSVVPVRASDDATTLAQRVLATEHVIYPRAVRWFIHEQIALNGDQVTLTTSEPQYWMAEEHATV